VVAQGQPGRDQHPRISMVIPAQPEAPMAWEEDSFDSISTGFSGPSAGEASFPTNANVCQAPKCRKAADESPMRRTVPEPAGLLTPGVRQYWKNSFANRMPQLLVPINRTVQSRFKRLAGWGRRRWQRREEPTRGTSCYHHSWILDQSIATVCR
jgi:hypothetical protein